MDPFAAVSARVSQAGSLSPAVCANLGRHAPAVDSALVRLAGPRESADDEDLDAATAARLPVRTVAVENGSCDPVWEGGPGGRLVIPYALALVKSGAALAATSPDASKAAAESDAVDVTLSVELWNENAVSDDLIGVQASLDLTGMLNSKVRVAPRTMLCQCCVSLYRRQIFSGLRILVLNTCFEEHIQVLGIFSFFF